MVTVGELTWPISLIFMLIADAISLLINATKTVRYTEPFEQVGRTQLTLGYLEPAINLSLQAAPIPRRQTQSAPQIQGGVQQVGGGVPARVKIHRAVWVKLKVSS